MIRYAATAIHAPTCRFQVLSVRPGERCKRVVGLSRTRSQNIDSISSSCSQISRGILPTGEHLDEVISLAFDRALLLGFINTALPQTQ